MSNYERWQLIMLVFTDTQAPSEESLILKVPGEQK